MKVSPVTRMVALLLAALLILGAGAGALAAMAGATAEQSETERTDQEPAEDGEGQDREPVVTSPL